MRNIMYAAVGLMMTTATAMAAGTPYHEGSATIIEPTDERNPLAEVVSGIDFRKSMIREMQEDEFSNPGMIVVDYGAEIWEQVDGTAGKSLSDVWASCAGMDAATAAVVKLFHWNSRLTIAVKPQWALSLISGKKQICSA